MAFTTQPPQATRDAEVVPPARPRRTRHTPVRSGLLVVILAGAITLGAPLLRPTAEPPTASEAPRTRPAVATTSNVRARPEAGAPVVAVLPGGHTLEVVGRLPDSSWLLVQTGPTEADRGWLPADRLALSETQRNELAVAAPAEAAPGRESTPAGLPDLVIASVFLMRDGHIALEIRNDGDGPLTEAKVPVLVTRASGETVGVLEVGPTTLPPRGTATVVTPVIVLNTGTYTLQLDRQESINEVRRDNNGATRLLVAGGG
ncbi:MAG: SH3 domain-containing protein [Dehalococcoidia bacterium]|nr:SH3 domain-containing protein [Dehalococcoidia bacterium]